MRFAKVVFSMVMLCLAASAVAAEARTRLQDDRVIEDGLRIVAIGKMLHSNCEAISPRRLKALRFALSLQRRARDMGYSDAEIDAYLDSDADKARIKADARRYLEARGVEFENPASFCDVGQGEIRNATNVGQFLRVD